jgi:hypothetical protein
VTENGGVSMTPNKRWLFLFTCPNGHPNFTKRHDAVVLGKYCPACAMEKKGHDQIKYTKSDLVAYAASKGGAFLSDVYCGWNSVHRWQCKENTI